MKTTTKTTRHSILEQKTNERMEHKTIRFHV